MRDAEPSLRLPLSGLGADGPTLVIAPPGHPTIALDARLLDRVELIGRSPAPPATLAAGATAGLVWGAIASLPGGPVAGVALAVLAFDRLREARRRMVSRDLLLVLGDLEVALHVADGAAAARDLAERLAPYTRGAPLATPASYEDARRRLHAHGEGQGEAARRAEAARALRLGDHLVRVEDGRLVVGEFGVAIEEVRALSLRGANLQLPGGRLLQAALGLLVVAADARARAGEDLDGLARRISAYEAWAGRLAGR